MGKLENNLKNHHDRTLTRWQRLWRINAGQGWIGKIVEKKNGFIKLAGFMPFYGAPAGFSDQIGFDSIEITPEMVGQRVAVFVACELKATKNDKLNPDQVNFKKLVVSMGGIHLEVREDCSVIENGFLCK